MTPRIRTDSHPDMDRLLAAWRRWRWLGLAAFLVIAAGGIGIAKFLPSVYRSTATILIERPQVPESIVRSTVSSDLETRLQTIREQLMSRSRLWEVIVAHDLYREARKTLPADVVVNQMRHDLSVELKGVERRSEPGSTIALSISYQGRDPKKVADVANTLAQACVDENSRSRERQVRGTSDFLRNQLTQAEKQLRTQQQKVDGYQRAYSSELPGTREAVISALERLSSQLDRNLEMQSRTKERLAMVERDIEMPPPPAPLPDGSESDEARIARLRAQLAEARQRYTEQYPDVVALKSEIATLEKRLSASPARASSGPRLSPSVARATSQRQLVEGELKALQAEERQLRPVIASYQARLERMPQRDLELQEISRDYATTREQYDSLVKRYSDAALAERVELKSNGEEFSILDPAVPAIAPVAPARYRLMGMGVLFALGVTLALMFIADRLDGSFHSVADVRDFTTVPVLASVPPIVTAGDRARTVLRFSVGAAVVALLMAAVVGGAFVIAHGNDGLVRLVTRGGS